MLWLWYLTHGVREWTLGHVVQEDDICFILFDEVYAADIRLITYWELNLARADVIRRAVVSFYTQIRDDIHIRLDLVNVIVDVSPAHQPFLTQSSSTGAHSRGGFWRL